MWPWPAHDWREALRDREGESRSHEQFQRRGRASRVPEDAVPRRPSEQCVGVGGADENTSRVENLSFVWTRLRDHVEISGFKGARSDHNTAGLASMGQSPQEVLVIGIGAVSLAAFILAGFCQLVRVGRVWRALLVPGVFLAAYFMAYGKVPSFPPVGAVNKIFYIALLGAVLGLIVDLANKPRLSSCSSTDSRLSRRPLLQSHRAPADGGASGRRRDR